MTETTKKSAPRSSPVAIAGPSYRKKNAGAKRTREVTQNKDKVKIDEPILPLGDPAKTPLSARFEPPQSHFIASNPPLSAASETIASKGDFQPRVQPMKSRILLSVPHMGGREQSYVAEAFATNWLSTIGPNVTAFEREFGHQVGMPSVALSSGTAAMHLGLRLLGVGPGDEVFCPTLTFVATANPIVYVGAEPVFLDSNREDWNLDPELLARALADRARRNKLPKAVVVVHLYGQPADMDPILAACARYEVPVLEDAAEALGSTYKGKPVGHHSGLAVYSFNGNKMITTTGGGMLSCTNPDWIQQARFWSTQARDNAIWYEHSEMGYNYRMSNVLAGIGRGQLEVLNTRVDQRRSIAFRYRDAFADIPGLEFMPQSPHGIHTNWLSCFLIDEALFGCSRDALISALDAAGIETRPVWKPMHLQPLYRHAESIGGEIAEDLFMRGICLPSSSSLTPVDQMRVITAVRNAAGVACQ